MAGRHGRSGVVLRQNYLENCSSSCRALDGRRSDHFMPEMQPGPKRDTNVFCCAGKEHPELESSSDIVLTYVRNTYGRARIGNSSGHLPPPSGPASFARKRLTLGISFRPIRRHSIPCNKPESGPHKRKLVFRPFQKTKY